MEGPGILRYAGERGIVLPDGAAEKFLAYGRVLAEYNRQLNLTRITGEQDTTVKHFLDSLELARFLAAEDNLLDVGSGAGFPGIPLKIALPALKVTLLESQKKKCRFLEEAIRILELENIEVVNGRAEDLARHPGFREKFAVVTARALAPLPVLLELCIPFVRPGGLFAAYKGPDYESELARASFALKELAAVKKSIHLYELPGGAGERALLFFRRTGPLPDRYPRKAGIPAKRPLEKQDNF